jgi:RNA polymerase sigma-70 factor (sigma-E family)
MESEEPGGTAALPWTDSGWPDARGIPAADSAAAVAALYQNHAGGLIRLAYLMLGDRAGAEDAVQDAFCGLYRHWDRLTDQDRALAYVRTAVLNACRSALRRRARGRSLDTYQPPTASAEAAVLGREERQEVMRAVRQLPSRQREALVLRYYLDLPEREIARLMGLRPSSVRSATARALKALGHALGEPS